MLNGKRALQEIRQAAINLAAKQGELASALRDLSLTQTTVAEQRETIKRLERQLGVAERGLTQIAFPSEHIAAIESSGTGTIRVSVTDFPRQALATLQELRTFEHRRQPELELATTAAK